MNINLNLIKGKRTYLIAFFGVVINGLYAMGYISSDWLPVVNTLLGFLGLATLRMSIK